MSPTLSRYVFRYVSRTQLLALGLLVMSLNTYAVDDYTLELYQSYCDACHTTSVSGAPQAFDIDEWTQRLHKGKDQVIENAISGFGNMPPFGSCMECTYEDLEDLVNYMSVSSP